MFLYTGMPNIQWEASKLDWSRNNLCRVQAEPSLSDVTVAACLQHCGVVFGLQHCDFGLHCGVGLQHCGLHSVVLVLVALVGSWAGQSVQHLMNCHRSGEIWADRRAIWFYGHGRGLRASPDDRNDRRGSCGYGQGGPTEGSGELFYLIKLDNYRNLREC